MTMKEASAVVLNILRARQKLNNKGGRKFIALSANAKSFLRRGKIGRTFWRRLRCKYSKSLKVKKTRRVSLKRGLKCTRSMAVGYLDELAEELISSGIATNLVKIEPGVWEGTIDTSRIWAHDETPQFVNYSKRNSKANVLAGVGDECQELTKENRDCVTVQPFSSFDGDLAMCQVLFSGAGHTSHMAPELAVEKISNLLVTVNEHGVTTHKSLLSACKELDEILIKQVHRNLFSL